MLQGLAVGSNTLWVNGFPSVLVSVSQGHFLPFKVKTGERKIDNWGVQGQGDLSSSLLGL